MSSKYDRVSYPDDLRFARLADRDGEDYQGTGNGIYNDYTVEVPTKKYTRTFKIACFNFEKSKKKQFILCGAVSAILVIILMIIIITASGKKSSPPGKQYGLFAYPVAPNGISLLSFDPANHESYMPYFNNMMHHISDYSPVTQESQPDTYVTCTNKTTSLAKGKQCLQTTTEFGPNCDASHDKMFGLMTGRPCVLLQLNLDGSIYSTFLNKTIQVGIQKDRLTETSPDSPMPKPFDFSGSKNAELKQKLAKMEVFYPDNSVAVSCEGKTQKDKDIIGTTKFTGPPIAYHPNKGFPLYYFLGRKDTDYFPPAVMLQFNNIPMNHMVNVRCTAWAANFNNGNPQDSDVYSTDISFNLRVVH